MLILVHLETVKFLWQMLISCLIQLILEVIFRWNYNHDTSHDVLWHQQIGRNPDAHLQRTMSNYWQKENIDIIFKKLISMKMAAMFIYLSGVATRGSRGRECPSWHWKNCQKLGKREKIRKKQEKERKNRKKKKNWEGSFTLPLLTDRAGYTTGLPEGI